jgi:hypothetical protein
MIRRAKSCHSFIGHPHERGKFVADNLPHSMHTLIGTCRRMSASGKQVLARVNLELVIANATNGSVEVIYVLNLIDSYSIQTNFE